MREKLERIFERTDKEYLTLSDIKKQLKISKKHDNYAQKCADLSDALNALISENYLVPDDFNRFFDYNMLSGTECPRPRRFL